MTTVGIDAVELHTGKLELDLAATFAPATDQDPEKFTKGLGLRASSLPDANEDIVTMAANAAHRLMEREGLEPADVGRIDVATETAFDLSKPVSTYVAGCLEQVYDGDFRHANKGERKFACIAATQALDDACNWIRAGRHRGRGALVIATDTALYERGDPGEATQGAGAVAMWVTEDPAVVELSVEQGYGSVDETDFLKPNQQFPSVDGQRSMQVYLSRLAEALEDYESVAGGTHPDDFRYLPFHTPFPGMVRKAAPLVYRHLVRDTDVEASLADGIGRHPRREDFADAAAYDAAVEAYADALSDTDASAEWYAETVEPSLEILRDTGNWYTGSVHVARASVLRHAADAGVDLAGERLLVSSYGSGAQAEVHAETVADGWRERIEGLDVDGQIEARYGIDFEQYEAVHAHHTHGSDVEIEPFTEPDGEFVRTGVGEMQERTYAYR